jgi:glycosyltransferase involved in cell wall biosynthesis
MAIKALYILDSLNRGGAETLVLDLCRNASSNGLDVIFTATGGGDLESEFEECGVPYHRLQRRFPIDPFLIRSLRRIIKDNGITVVHTQQAVEAIHAYFATRGTGAKCVMSLQNYILDEKNRIATKWVVPRLDAVCPVSHAMQEWFRTAEGFPITERYFVLHNGVDPSRLKPIRPAGSKTLREELGISPEASLIGMVGNFYPDRRKDQLTVCRALERVFAANPNAHFVFVGSVHRGAEDYLAECKEICRRNAIDDRVHFVGRRSDIPDILGELSLFVFSSVQEGLPVAAVEALMMGVAMIVSDIPPLLEVIGADQPKGPCAEIFVTGDENDLAAKITALLIDNPRRVELGRTASSTTLRRFGIDSHIKRVIEIYESLANGS